MKRKLSIMTILLLVFFLSPLQALADDFSISDVQIDAQLQGDGTVQVTEQHTYVFEDDFNGMTRGLAAKEGTAITDVRAFEGNTELEVERDGDLYMIHRPADDETVVMELQYTIEGAVELYEDGAEFYWPFFDNSNESDYGNLVITVTPPSPASQIDFLGYDEAYETGSMEPDGTVVFDLGEVPAERNGDIRVVYESELFAGLAVNDGTVRDALAADRQQLIEQAIAFEENQETASSIGAVAVPVASITLLGLLGILWNRARSRKKQADDGIIPYQVPKDGLSIPAALYFTHSPFLDANTLSAAMMELVRKGYVLQHSEKEFELVSSKTEFPHERTLIDLLFGKVGKDNVLHIDELEAYTKDTDNHADYNGAIADFNKQVADEVKGRGFYDREPIIRWVAGGLALLFMGSAIYMGVYDLFVWMGISIAMAFVAIAFALFHSPLTVEGHRTKLEWKKLKESMDELPEAEWNRWTADEKQRAVAYHIGTSGEEAAEQANVFHASDDSGDYGSIAFNPAVMTVLFVAAASHTGSASASSGTSVGGGGVGGGGGGSGAF